jgi:hypothetical protein
MPVILAVSLTVMLVVTTYLLNPFVPASYLRYLQVGEVALVGFFAIHTISMTSYSLSISYSEQTAKSISSVSGLPAR